MTYHMVGAGASRYTIGEKQFRAQMELLKADGYVVEGFEQLENRLRAGQVLPHPYVILTVDDGHESAMLVADILAEYNCQATFFVTRDRSLKQRGFIRGPGIRELRRRRFSLGTHGTTHRKLTLMSEESCIDELRGSKEWLEDVISEEVRYMSAPGGFINARIMKLAHEYGYILIGTCNEWMNSPKAMTLPGEVNRVNIRRHFAIGDIQRIVEGHLGFYVWRQVRAAALAVPKQLLRCL